MSSFPFNIADPVIWNQIQPLLVRAESALTRIAEKNNTTFPELVMHIAMAREENDDEEYNKFSQMISIKQIAIDFEFVMIKYDLTPEQFLKELKQIQERTLCISKLLIASGGNPADDEQL